MSGQSGWQGSLALPYPGAPAQLRPRGAHAGPTGSPAAAFLVLQPASWMGKEANASGSLIRLSLSASLCMDQI